MRHSVLSPSHRFGQLVAIITSIDDRRNVCQTDPNLSVSSMLTLQIGLERVDEGLELQPVRHVALAGGRRLGIIDPYPPTEEGIERCVRERRIAKVLVGKRDGVGRLAELMGALHDVT